LGLKDWSKKKLPLHKSNNDDPLVCGLSNEWLWWIPASVVRPKELEGMPERMFDYGVYRAPQYPNEDWRELVTDGAMCRLKFGYGVVLFDQIRWDVNTALLGKQLDYLRWLMTAVGVRLGTGELAIDPALASATFEPIDLRKVCNRGLSDDEAHTGWLGIGPQRDLRNMPVGRQRLGGVLFEMIDQKQNGGRSCLILHGSRKNKNPVTFPLKSEPIAVGRKARLLAFHHAGAFIQEGDVLGTYVVDYDDGTSVKIPAVAGLNVNDWWQTPQLISEARPAWIGPVADGNGQDAATYVYLWKNPHPEQTIRSITVYSGDPDDTEADRILPHGILAVLSITTVQ
jgi:beta-galactosidase